jgi:hypothetical protein
MADVNCILSNTRVVVVVISVTADGADAPNPPSPPGPGKILNFPDRTQVEVNFERTRFWGG